MKSAEEKTFFDVTEQKIQDEAEEIESILKDIGGSFGNFQIFSYCLYSIPMFVIGILTMGFLFSAAKIDHRYVFLSLY